MEKEEISGFWIIGVALILMVGIPYWNNLNEWVKLILEIVLFFWGFILIIKGRIKRRKPKK